MAIERGQVYYVDLGPPSNGSHVAAERHYVVVVQSDKLNKLKGYSVVVVVPTTSKLKKVATRVEISPVTDFDQLDANHAHALKGLTYAKCEQVLSLDVSCFTTPVGKLKKEKVYGIAKTACEFALGIES